MLSEVGQSVTGMSNTMFCLVTRYWASVQGRHQWKPDYQYPRNSPFLVTTAMTPSGLKYCQKIEKLPSVKMIMMIIIRKWVSDIRVR